MTEESKLQEIQNFTKIDLDKPEEITPEQRDTMNAMFEEWRQNGVDVGRLAGAAAAALIATSGNEVYIGADAGESVAADNILPAVVLLFQGAMVAWTAYELYDNATTTYELVDAYINGELTDEQFEDALLEAGLNVVIDVSVGKLKILEKSYELARKAGLTDKADDLLSKIASHKNDGISGPNTADGVPIREYPDGSFRTPDGKFASQGGLPSPGTKSAQEYTQYLRDNGFDVVGEELTVSGAVGNRRYDAVVRTDSGELWGIEYKSGGATKTPQQDFNDMYINQFGADGVGKLAGETVVGNITIYLP